MGGAEASIGCDVVPNDDANGCVLFRVGEIIGKIGDCVCGMGAGFVGAGVDVIAEVCSTCLYTGITPISSFLSAPSCSF